MKNPPRRTSTVAVDGASHLAGIGLGLTVALQVTTLERSDFSSIYASISSFSRLCALVGTYFALLSILLVARIPWVERGVGHDRLITWHRKLGPYALFLVGFHVLFVTLGLAGQDQISFGVELWRICQQYPWMWPGAAGFLFMMIAGVTSYRKARAKMSYETWWVVHLYMYLAIALSFMHQVLNGPMFIEHPLNRAYWTGLYLFVAFSIIFWRIGISLVRSVRHDLRVFKVVQEGPGVISVIMKGRTLHKLGAEGGQFFGWRFLSRDQMLTSHPFSLSAAPSEHYLRITVKNLGDHSRSLARLKPGTRAFMEGPYGAFTAGRSSGGHAVLVAGGLGITPVRAIMEEFPEGTQIDVLFRASQTEDLVLREELDYLAVKSEGAIRVHYLVGSRAKHPMDAHYLTQLVPNFANSDIYICGPSPLVEAVREAAIAAGIPKRRFHDEAFAFHSE